jgi:hypothetical protein
MVSFSENRTIGPSLVATHPVHHGGLMASVSNHEAGRAAAADAQREGPKQKPRCRAAAGRLNFELRKRDQMFLADLAATYSPKS